MPLQKTLLFLLPVAIFSVVGIVVLRVTAQADTTPPTISAIVVDTITGNSAILHWITDEPTGTTPKIELSPGVYTAKSNSEFGTSHTYTFTELTPATTYHYRIYAQDSAGNATESADYIFATANATSSSSVSSSSVSSDRIFFVCLVMRYGGNAPFWSGSNLPQSPLGAEYAYTPAYQDLTLEAGRSYCAGLYEGLMQTYCSYGNNASLGDVEWGIGFYDANRRIYLGGGPGNGLALIHRCPSSSVSSVPALPPSSSQLSPRSASASTLSVSSLSITTVPADPVIPPSGSPNVPIPFLPLSSPVAFPARSGATLPPQMPTPVTHPVPSPKPTVQTGSSTVQKRVSTAKVQALKKQQQALRRELRTLERSLLRRKNVTALSQVTDLRDALYDLDLHDPSAAETLRSLQGEIAELRLMVAKKAKRRG